MAWQLICRLCSPLYRGYGPDLDFPGGLPNSFHVFEELLTYKNYDWGHFKLRLGALLCALLLDALSTDAQGLSLGHPHVARVVEATSVAVAAATMRPKKKKKNTNKKKKKPPTWGDQYKDPGRPGSLGNTSSVISIHLGFVRSSKAFPISNSNATGPIYPTNAV